MQDLTNWPGDVESLLTEMKRLAGVSTDTELARVLGTSQSNVSTWRKRGGVPKAALLTFERMNFEASPSAMRTWAARAIAIRVAEFAHERAGAKRGGKRWAFYITVASAWNLIIKAISDDLEEREIATRRWPLELAEEVMENDRYLGQLADWINSLSAAELLGGTSKPELPQ